MLKQLITTLAGLGLATLPAQQPDARQIRWQRSVEDALALARAQHRPLLIALNMDGESASDRIVHENYRDPAFVAATRRCVCVVGSVFRHNPRDHDDHGERIPCPRLGEVTCGEHMAIEPKLFEELMADGDRVAPRHALILPGSGEKAFDISLSFDLRDVDRALIEATRSTPLPIDPRWAGTDWSALAARRDHRGRLAFERALGVAPDDASRLAGLRALGLHGDAGAGDALRLLATRWPSLTPRLRDELVMTAGALGLRVEVGAALRDSFRSLGATAGSPASQGRDALLSGLARVDGASAPTRSFLLAAKALEDSGDAAGEALRDALGPEPFGPVDAASIQHGGPVSLAALFRLARSVDRAGDFVTRPSVFDEALVTEDELIDRLDALDRASAERRKTAEHQYRYAHLSLDLARRHMETGASDVPVLLEDAELHFRRALATVPDPLPRWWTRAWIERARCAYYLSRFDRQVEFALAALASATGRPVGQLPDERSGSVLDDEFAVEALRWIGDGSARQLAARSGGDPAVELVGIIDGLRALGLVASSPFSDANDWVSFASFCGALGLYRQELAIALRGVRRMPAAGELRQQLNGAVWNSGRIELAPALAERISRGHPETAENEWFAGYATILAAEDARRREDPAAAAALYARAVAHYRRVVELRADYLQSCRYWIGACSLGAALSEVRTERRARAAELFVDALDAGADLTAFRDGLGYDAFDLVDKLLEWRDSGPSPVRAVELLERIDGTTRDTPFWAAAISDAALREGLRADGRNPLKAMRDTVDAGGNPIRMALGLPTELGDRYLEAAVVAGRRAAARATTDADRRPLAQAATVIAERQLQRGTTEGVRAALVEAAAQFGWQPPPEDADRETLQAFALRLRAQLGEARPRFRPGR